MREVVLNSLKWVAIGKVLGQSVRWLTTIFTLRFLFPEDYAVIALSSFFTALLWSFSRSGIAAALIREKQVDNRLLGEFFLLTILAHTFLFILLQISASLLADVYGDPRLEAVIQVTSFTFLISLIGFIPGTLLNREMKFKKLSMVDALAESISALVTVMLAWLGYGYWSIVIGLLALETIKQCGYLSKNMMWVKPRRFTHRFKPVFEFSWKAALQATIGYSIFNIDIAIAGLYLSTTDLGFYQFAVVLAMMPAAKVLPLLRQVAFPVYTKIQADTKGIERYFLKSQRISALLFVPIFWGIAGTASTLVPVVFGEKWQPAALVITIYCLSMPIKCLEQLFGPVLKARNKLNVTLSNTAIYGFVLIPSFFIGAHFGGVGIALAWLLTFLFCFLIATYRACHALDISFKNYLLAINKPHINGLVMLITCFLMGLTLVDVVGPFVTLLLQISAGAIIYIGLTWVFSKEDIKELINLFRKKAL